MPAEMRHGRVAVIAAAVAVTIAGVTTIVDGAAAVIARSAAIVAVAVIIVAAVLGGSDRKTGTDDPGKSRRGCGTATTAIIPAAGADIGRAAGPGRGRHA